LQTVSYKQDKVKNKREFRNNGAIGAFLDKYERALNELIVVIENLTQEQLTCIIDFDTKDKDCKSIDNILFHIVQSGYTYVLEIRKWLAEKVEYRNRMKFSTIEEYKSALRNC